MEWIKTTERVPDNEYPVLAIDENGEIGLAYFYNNLWNAPLGFILLDWNHSGVNFDFLNIVWWMQLPEPPKE